MKWRMANGEWRIGDAGSWPQYVSRLWRTLLSMNPTEAIHGAIHGPLTPTLSRRERETRITRLEWANSGCLFCHFPIQRTSCTTPHVPPFETR